jgi:hypothetical protein
MRQGLGCWPGGARVQEQTAAAGENTSREDAA